MRSDEAGREGVRGTHRPYSGGARGGDRAIKVGNASAHFDAGLVLDLVELFAFVEATQAKA